MDTACCSLYALNCGGGHTRCTSWPHPHQAYARRFRIHYLFVLWVDVKNTPAKEMKKDNNGLISKHMKIKRELCICDGMAPDRHECRLCLMQLTSEDCTKNNGLCSNHKENLLR